MISIARLNPLRDLHLQPICGVVSPEPLNPSCDGPTTLNLEDGFALICLQRLSKLGFSYPAMPLTGQPVHQSPIHPGPLVLGMNPLKYRTPTADKDQTVSRMFIYLFPNTMDYIFTPLLERGPTCSLYGVNRELLHCDDFPRYSHILSDEGFTDTVSSLTTLLLPHAVPNWANVLNPARVPL